MEVLVYVPVLLFSFVAHEFAHAWVAYRQGDPTAYQLGRVTLNPIPHIDLFGTILIPAMLIATGSNFLIGWAKPVPVVSRNFRNYRRGDLLVSVAGVTANFIIAIACTLLMIGLVHSVRAVPSLAGIGGTVQDMLEIGISLNFILVVFNLLPVPPLDGSRLMYHVLPERIALWYRGVERWGFLVFVVLLLTGAISTLLWPAGALMQLSRALIEWST
jgi:Zn-dependent protease